MPSVVFSDDKQGAGATSITFTPSAAPTAGNVVSVCVRNDGLASSNIQTPASWTRGAESPSGTAAPFVWLHRSVAAGPDFSSITVDFTSAPSNYDMSWVESALTTTTEDQADTEASGSGTTATLGTQTPTQNAVLALATASTSGTNGGAVSATEGFTLLTLGNGTTDRLIVAYKAITSGVATGGPVITWTTSRTYKANLFLLRASESPRPFRRFPRGLERGVRL